MEPKRIEFSSVHEPRLIASLGQLLEIKPVRGAVTVPPMLGNGTVVQKELEKDLVLVCWNFNLHVGVLFAKKPAPPSASGRTYVINYLVAAEDVVLESPALRKSFQLKGGLNILLFGDDTEINFSLRENVQVGIVSISVKAGWIEKEFGTMQSDFPRFMENLFRMEKPSVILESSTPVEFRWVSEILENARDIPAGIANLKPRIMMLVADFFMRLYERPADIIDSRIMHFQKMQRVKEILVDHLEKKLPDLDGISRLVNLSVSTLKRHFKINFECGIYEYYLGLKMEHAKRLLLERDLSVNEAASILNYENVSSFIESFKKHHGFSPGEIRRRSA